MNEMLQEAGRQILEIRQREKAQRAAEGLPRFGMLSFSELQKFAAEQRLKNPPLYEWDDELQVYHVYWGGYDYQVDYERIEEPAQLIGAICHLAAKGWELTTPQRLGKLAESIARRRGWDIWS